jgi:hypothetical protein
VKHIANLLVLFSVLAAGCIGFPKSPDKSGKGGPFQAGALTMPPPAPVNPDDVTEKNLRQKIRELETEIHHDERQN